MDRVIGVIAGSFDIIHPGYVRAFRFCKEHCRVLVVMLNTDPEDKVCVLSSEEREEILLAMKDVDRVIRYTGEEDLAEKLAILAPDIRFLGDDYLDKSKSITGMGICPITYIDRSHGWSTTKIKEKIVEATK